MEARDREIQAMKKEKKQQGDARREMKAALREEERLRRKARKPTYAEVTKRSLACKPANPGESSVTGPIELCTLNFFQAKVS